MGCTHPMNTATLASGFYLARGLHSIPNAGCARGNRRRSHLVPRCLLRLPASPLAHNERRRDIGHDVPLAHE